MADSETPSQTLPAETLAFAARIFDAAREGNSDLLLPALDAGLPVNLTNDSGNSLLMLSAYAGHASLTKALLERGADVSRINDRGQSILAGAVFRSVGNIKPTPIADGVNSNEETNPYITIIEALLASGADPRVGTPSAMDTARMFGGKPDGNGEGNKLTRLLGATIEDLQKVLPGMPPMGPPGH